MGQIKNIKLYIVTDIKKEAIVCACAMSKPVLYSYFRSSCSWRVRIALNLKAIEYEYKPVNLLNNEHSSDDYKVENPQGCVPTLVVDGHSMSQSISIIEYLDEVYPECPLLPRDDPMKRADVRRLSLLIAADIQPVQNLRVLKKVGADKKMEWGHWAIETGFKALERSLEKTAGKYSYGDELSMVDLCLVPQVYNANRFKVDMTQFPTISKVHEELINLDAFKAAHPSKQPDCPEDLR